MNSIQLPMSPYLLLGKPFVQPQGHIRAGVASCKAKHIPWRRARYVSSSRRHGPLRILFCGADEFSIYSLRSLRQLQEQKPESVASIDVVCRPDKRVGRGLKQIREVPIKGIATELHLPLHQIDTFTGWTPPSPVDLVVAVSFGLLVPSRILTAATYGGINVHPSLLPDLRGPAPIVHALLQDRTHTGVTVQTMHPTRFDHGVILAQSSAPGVLIPQSSTPDQLLHLLGPIGAEMLRQSIEDGLFISPRSAIDSVTTTSGLQHAPKASAEDRHIDWNTWTANRIFKYDHVLGKLWDTTTVQACAPSKGPKRLTFHGPWQEVPLQSLTTRDGHGQLETGAPALSLVDASSSPRLAIKTTDGKAVSPSSATIEGERKGMALFSLIDALRKR